MHKLFIHFYGVNKTHSLLKHKNMQNRPLCCLIRKTGISYIILICVNLDHKIRVARVYLWQCSQQYIVWVKIIDFLLCQKSLGYKVNIMFNEDIL